MARIRSVGFAHVATTLVAVVLVISAASSGEAGTCSVKITWAPSTGSSSSDTIHISQGSTQNVNQDGMLRVKNKGSNQIRIYVSIVGAPNINRVLDGGESDPPGGINYGPYHTLTQVECLEGGGGSPLSPEGLVASLLAAGTPVQQILAQVKTTFSLSASEMVELARDTNLDVVLSAQAVKSLYGGTQSQFATWHFDAGYDAPVVAAVLRSVFQASAEQIAGLMEAQGLGCVAALEAVAAAIQNLTAEAAAYALKTAGYAPDEVLLALTQVLGVGSAIAAAAVMAATYPPALAVNAISTVITSHQQLAEIVYENIDSGQIILIQATEALKQAQVARDTAHDAMVAAARWALVLIESVLDNVFGPLLAGTPGEWDAWQQAAASAALAEARAWIANATIDKRTCEVNGPLASGGAGIMRSSEPVGGGVSRALRRAGAPDDIANAWDRAFTVSWNRWARRLSLPAAPWYPSFASWPGAKAPPQPNVPTPLGTLVSSGAEAMSPQGLASKVGDELGDAASEPGAATAIGAFATTVGERFARCMSVCQIETVMGSGPVPSYRPPAVPAGPVVAGACWGGVILGSPF